MIGIVMGSASDWDTMQAAAKMLEEFGVPYEAKAMSAHRTPDLVAEWAKGAAKRGLKAIIAQMPKGIPVATFAIGEAGAANAALYAIAMLALSDRNLSSKLEEFRKKQAEAVRKTELPKP